MLVSEVTPILTFIPASDVLTGMLEVCISSKMDFNIGTAGGVETVEIAAIVELVKIVDESGSEIVRSEVLTEVVVGVVVGKGGMEEIRIVVGMGEVLVLEDAGLHGGGRGGSVTTRNFLL